MLKVCALITCYLFDLKSSLVVYRGKVRKKNAMVQIPMDLTVYNSRLKHNKTRVSVTVGLHSALAHTALNPLMSLSCFHLQALFV